jgi:glutathione synthase/RimK-type ligase-like ATP-grasp enzyme
MNQQTTNTRCLIEATKRLGLSCDIFDKNGNFLRVKVGNKNLDFANYSTPFNTNSFCKITRDKEFTSFLLNEVVKMPKTLAFVDPNYDEGGEIRPEPNTLENYINKIIQEFNFPIVLKPNSLHGGKNFSLCSSKEEIMNAFGKIFAKNKDYDYLALAQEYVRAEAEYRAIVFKNEMMFIYTRKTLISDEKIINEIKEFIKPIFSILPIDFAGLDIIVSETGEKYLLEINSEPGFANFVAKNGDEALIEMYNKILKFMFQ